jgi:LacI family transcriptional regulator
MTTNSEEGRPRLATIAAEVGVSVTTVHRALFHTGPVAAHTREAIEASAARLGYRPNLLARSLAHRRSATLGLVSSLIGGHVTSTIIGGMTTSARALGYDLMLALSDGRSDRERVLVEGLLERAVDGLLLLPVDSDDNREHYQKLVTQGVPMVFVERHLPGVTADAVATDNVEGGRRAGEHLLAYGCRRIAFLPPRAAPGGHWRHFVDERLRGLNAALGSAGAPAAAVVGPQESLEPVAEIYAYQAMREWLAAGGELDGLFACFDHLAHGAMRALLESGRRLPQDVAVVGFDDTHTDQVLRPYLTSLRQPKLEIAERAVRRLVERLEGDDRPPQDTFLPPELHVRESSGGDPTAPPLGEAPGGYRA